MSNEESVDLQDFGIVLRVLRLADGMSDSKDGVSNQHTRLTLTGIVDYVGTAREKKVISPLANVPIDENSPRVWLVRGRFTENHRSIVPSDDTGEPMEWTVEGSNYATSTNDGFWGIVGNNHGAIPIWDATDNGQSWEH